MWFVSNVFFAIARVNLLVSRLSSPDSGSPRKVALVLEFDVVVGLDLSCRQEKMVFLLW